MARKQSIIDELENLGSLLSQHQPATVYQVPEGYFQHFPEQMLSKLHMGEVLEEKLLPAPVYNAPAGYFESFPQKMLDLVKNQDAEDVNAELEGLSPLLSGLKKETPYKVQEGYFDQLTPPVPAQPAAKVVSMGGRNNWLRYAAAAVITGFLALSGFLYYEQNLKIDPVSNPQAWVKKEVKQISTDELESFIELANIEATAIAPRVSNPVRSSDMNQLMQDVPEEDINSFLNETSGLDINGDLILN